MQTLCIVRFIMEYSSNSEYKIWCFDKVFWSWSEHVLCVIIFRLFSTAGYQYIYLARKLSECLTKSGYIEIHGPCTNVCVFMCNYNVSLIFLTALFLFWTYIIIKLIQTWFSVHRSVHYGIPVKFRNMVIRQGFLVMWP